MREPLTDLSVTFVDVPARSRERCYGGGSGKLHVYLRKMKNETRVAWDSCGSGWIVTGEIDDLFRPLAQKVKGKWSGWWSKTFALVTFPNNEMDVVREWFRDVLTKPESWELYSPEFYGLPEEAIVHPQKITFAQRSVR